MAGERIGVWDVEGARATLGGIDATIEAGHDGDELVLVAEGFVVAVPLPVLAALLRARGWTVAPPPPRWLAYRTNVLPIMFDAPSKEEALRIAAERLPGEGPISLRDRDEHLRGRKP